MNIYYYLVKYVDNLNLSCDSCQTLNGASGDPKAKTIRKDQLLYSCIYIYRCIVRYLCTVMWIAGQLVKEPKLCDAWMLFVHQLVVAVLTIGDVAISPNCMFSPLLVLWLFLLLLLLHCCCYYTSADIYS